jgi:hypothetical protein
MVPLFSLNDSTERVDDRFDVEIRGSYLLNPSASVFLSYRYANAP